MEESDPLMHRVFLIPVLLLSMLVSTSTAAASFPTHDRVPAPVEPRQPRGPVPPPKTPTLVPGLLPAPRYSQWSNWRVTAQGVPYYRYRPACTVEQAHVVAAQFRARGASISTAQWAVYVASREGGCNYLATRVSTRTRDDSHCTFQLNAARGGPLSPSGYLGLAGWTRWSVKASLAACAQAAAHLWARCGKGPWVYGNYGCRRPTS